MTKYKYCVEVTVEAKNQESANKKANKLLVKSNEQWFRMSNGKIKIISCIETEV